MKNNVFDDAVKNFNTALKNAKIKVLNEMAVCADNFVPEDTRRTRNGMQIREDEDYIIWGDVPDNEYVEHIYWGVDINFHKDKNPNAQALWCDEATSRYADKWAEIIADEFIKVF